MDMIRHPISLPSLFIFLPRFFYEIFVCDEIVGGTRLGPVWDFEWFHNNNNIIIIYTYIYYNSLLSRNV